MPAAKTCRESPARLTWNRARRAANGGRFSVKSSRHFVNRSPSLAPPIRAMPRRARGWRRKRKSSRLPPFAPARPATRAVRRRLPSRSARARPRRKASLQIPASAQSADAGRRNALLPADERNEPVVHPIEFAPPLDMPRAFAPVARANEPAPLAARSERADTSARFAANERDAESVQIHIGRLEVIAVSEPAQRKPSKSDAPKYMSLDAHLARRSGRAG